MKEINYIILDFGKVLMGPTTGDWFITPKFIEIVDMSEIDIRVFKYYQNIFSSILSRKVINEEQEYLMFFEFYDNILRSMNYSKYDRKIIQELAYDITYNSTKYILYDRVIEELEFLSNKYKLILLSDNWPCVFRIMNEQGLTKYFDKIYVSSMYGCEKKDGIFFDFPIRDYNIEPDEALFIDDNEKLLSIAQSKGFNVMLMDRENKVRESNYEIIHSLDEINKKTKII